MRSSGIALSVGAAALLAAVCAKSALAADLPPVASQINWNGFYVGADAGAGFLESRYKRPFSNLGNISTGTIKPQPTYGLLAGFNYMVAPRFLVGLEGRMTFFDGARFNELNANLDFLLSTRHIDALLARAGYLVSPDTMVYGSLGPARIEVRGYKNFAGTFDTYLNGIQAAVGIETYVSHNIAIRAEAANIQSLDTLALNTGNDLYRPSFLQVALGATYKFDAPAGWGATPILEPAFVKDAATTWTGFEVGGFASLNGNAPRYADTVLGTQGSYSDLVIGGGGFVGFNYQVQPAIVVGVEASGDLQKAGFSTAAAQGVPPYYLFAVSNGFYAVTARAGWLANPGTLLYLKAGPSWIQFKTLANYWDAIVTKDQKTGSHYFKGYEVGIGVETFVTSNVSVRVEGDYVHSSDFVIQQGGMTNEFRLQPAILTGSVGAALHF